MPILKFFLAVSCLVLWITSSYISIIFFLTDYSDVIWLENINYHIRIFLKYDIVLTKNTYNLFVFTFRFITFLLSFIIAYSFIIRNYIRQELGSICVELNQVFRGIFQLIHNLTKTEKAIALSVLIAINVVRVYYLKQYYFTTDEVASFDFFVMEGPLAVTSFYPFPNNHIFSNLFSLFYYQFQTEPLLVMRVPTFFFSLVGTVIFYLVLIRYLGFVIATFSVSLFCFSQSGIFYSIAGRGYFLLTVLTFVCFFSLIGIYHNGGRQKLYWFLFIISGILCFYTVPTFLYPFTAILIIGLFYFYLKPAPGNIAGLIVSSLIISIGTILLYLPVIFVSGPDALFHNKYVQSVGGKSFGAGFTSYFFYTEGVLIGQERLGKYIIGLTLLITAVKIFYFKERGAFVKIVVPVLAMVFLPYLMMILHRVYPPERTLFYKLIYLYIVLSILFFWLLNVVLKNVKLKSFVAVLILIVHSSYHYYYLQKQVASDKVGERQVQEIFRWLTVHEGRNILVMEPYYGLYLNHYFKVAKIKYSIYSESKANMKYDFIILPKQPPVKAKRLGKKVYQDDFVDVYSFVK